MLGRSEGESGPQALRAAVRAGWASAGSEQDGEPEALLDLGSTSATLDTVASIEGLHAVVHLGHPGQPAHNLESALLDASPRLLVTAAVSVPARWMWVGASAEVTGAVVIDEVGMRDRRHTLRTMGASLRLVPARMPLAERLALAGDSGSLVLEQEVVPPGYVELAGSAALCAGPEVWYGLVEARAQLPEFSEPSQVWLAFGPHDDHEGSLRETLGLIADSGIDLQHLRSDRSAAGPHIFFSAFSCADSALLTRLTKGFDSRRVAHRVLAVIPGSSFGPGEDVLVPQWSAPPGGNT